MTIAVVCGGISPERNISLKSGKSVYNALSHSINKIIAIDPALGENCLIDFNNLNIENIALSKEKVLEYDKVNLINCVNSSVFNDVDIVFSLLHGLNGEDGLFQSLLELRNIPYVGSGVKSSAITMDKISTKMLLTYAGIPTPPWEIIESGDEQDLDFIEEIRKNLGQKLVVKPPNQGSAVGINIILNGNLDDIQTAINNAGKFSNQILIESYIPGREITVGILDNEAMPIVEIKPKEGYYDFENKYIVGKTEYICPAEIDDELSFYIKNLAVNAAQVCSISDYGRIDFRVTEDNEVFCLEVNTIPGFTDTSLFPMAAKNHGFEFNELCLKLVELGLESSKKGK